MKLFKPTLFCFLACLLSSIPLMSGARDEYKALSLELSQFRKNERAQKYRKNYELLARKFKRFHQKFPGSLEGQSALLVSAKINMNVAKVTKKPEDWEKAKSAFLESAKRYPGSAKSNDSLYFAAQIAHYHLFQRQDAFAYLRRVFENPSAGEKNRKRAAALFRAMGGVVPKSPSKQPIFQKENFGKNSTIKSLDISILEQELRLSLKFAKSVQITQGEIKASKTRKRRLYFDISPARLDLKIPSRRKINAHGVHAIRFGQFTGDVARIVLDVDDTVHFSKKKRSQKNDWVLSFSKLAAAVNKKPTPRHSPKRTSRRPLRIVLDPGHGGKDSGAVSKHGMLEKTLTLKMALEAKKRIEKLLPTAQVYLTRNKDKTLALKTRTAIANRLKADIFVSIHINAHRSAKVRGIETYYLDIGSDHYANRLAARENAMNLSEVSDLEFVLADLAVKSYTKESIKLGELVQSNTVKGLRRHYSRVENLGLKHALFYVLLGAKMPSVLVEAGFLSNPQEARRLRGSKYQKEFAHNLALAIQKYAKTISNGRG